MTSILSIRPWKKHPLHWVADLLSAANLACGALSIHLALQQRLSWCLVLLGLGALFDGLDGAAARRWGGSRFGVLADDVADGISYGIAPAVAPCPANPHPQPLLPGGEGEVTT
jgi:CDP-diacylglycerol--serine O-phosphatidyltransferase